MQKFTNRFTDDDLEDAKASRDSILNPPDADVGMEDSDDYNFDSINSDSLPSGADSGWGSNSDLSHGFGETVGFGGQNEGGRSHMFEESPNFFGDGQRPYGGFSKQYGTPEQQNKPQNEYQTPEDKAFAVAGAGVKHAFGFAVELVQSFSSFDTRLRTKFGRNVFFTGLGLGVTSILMFVLHFGNGWTFLISACLTAAIGSVMFMLGVDSLRTQEEEEMCADNSEPMNTYQEETEIEPYNENYMEQEENIYEDNTPMFVPDEPEPLFKESKGFDYDADEDEEPKVDSQVVLDSLNGNMGMVTRQYLYETIMSSLDHKKKNFYDSVELDENSREFLSFCKIVEKAGSSLAPKNCEEFPQLLRVEDKLFYTSLELSRVKWIKQANLKSYIEEIVNMCSFDPKTNKLDDSIFGMGNVVGDRLYIKIMKGETAMVTIKDVYLRVKDEILDTSNYMPVVFGIDEEGEVIWRDLKDMESLLVTGATRSGKSWFIKSILAQMMFFRKPSELNFYIFDPKGEISDFYSLNAPHVKKFLMDDNEILDTLRHIVTVEGNRRRQILSETGNYLNIWDMKKDHPEIELPLIYVVIDEVITLAERMDKETKAEFQGLLKQLVSQLPALGIRIFMIPHVLKNDIIQKTTTDLISCRICVCGSPAMIENVTGTTPRNFSYKLSHKGDMAVTLKNATAFFVHASVLSDTNGGTSDVFTFLTNMWLKIEPESRVSNRLGKSSLSGVSRSSLDAPIIAKSVPNSNVSENEEEYDEIEENEEFEDIEPVQQVVKPVQNRPKKPVIVHADKSEPIHVRNNDMTGSVSFEDLSVDLSSLHSKDEISKTKDFFKDD